MLKTRILLIVSSAIVISILFFLPKVVVNNEDNLTNSAQDSTTEVSPDENHTQATPEILEAIKHLRVQRGDHLSNEKNAIFADSLANLYVAAGKFDSAAWFAEEASKFFNTTESWIKAGDHY